MGFELVGEKAGTRVGGVEGVLGSAETGEVDKLILVDDGGWEDTLDFGAKFEKEVRLFSRLIRGHAAGDGFVRYLGMGFLFADTYMCAR
jgi:hypothetical protein